MGEKGCPTQGPPPRRPQEGRVTGKAALLSPVNVASLCPTPRPPPPKPVQPVGGSGFLPGTIPGNRRRKEVRWAGLGQTFCDTPPPPSTRLGPPPPPAGHADPRGSSGGTRTDARSQARLWGRWPSRPELAPSPAVRLAQAAAPLPDLVSLCVKCC